MKPLVNVILAVFLLSICFTQAEAQYLQWTPLEAPCPQTVQAFTATQHAFFAQIDSVLYSYDAANSFWNSIYFFNDESVIHIGSSSKLLLVETKYLQNKNRLYLSTNDGISWSRINNGLPNYIGSFFATSNAIFVSSGYSSFRSLDYGKTWVMADSAGKYHGITVPGDTLYNYVWSYVGDTTYVIISYSIDNGNTWIAGPLHRYNTNSSNCGSSNSVRITARFSIDSIVFTATDIAGVFRSKSDGSSCKSLNLPINMSYTSLAGWGNAIFVGTNHGGMFRSTDRGESWQTSNNGLNISEVRSVAILNSTLYAGTGGDYIYTSTDNGNTWSPFSNYYYFPKININAVATYGNNSVFFGSDNGFWSTSSDGKTGGNYPGVGAPTLSILPTSNYVFVGTSSSGIYRSESGTSTSQHLNSGILDTNITSLTFGRAGIYAGTEGGVYFSSDFGNSWQHADSGIQPKYIGSLIGTNTSVLAGNLDGVFRSTNGGVLWKQVGLTGIPTTAFAMKGDTIFAGTSGYGVYRSNDGGSSWFLASSRFAYQINSLTISGTFLFAGTDNGVFRTDLSSPPKIFSIAGPSSISLCSDSATIIIITPKYGTPPFTYLWQQSDGTAIPLNEILAGGTATDSILHIRPVQNRIIHVVVTDKLGKNAVKDISVNLIPAPNPTVIQNGNKLVCNITNASYQWYNSNGNPISSGDSQAYSPSAAGDYFVIVSVNGCTGASPAIHFSFSSVNYESAKPMNVTIIPNPALNEIAVTYFSLVNSPAQFEISDLLGNQILQTTDNNTSIGERQMKLDVSKFPQRMYILTLRSGNQNSVEKFTIIR